MVWFLYDRDLRHEGLKRRNLKYFAFDFSGFTNYVPHAPYAPYMPSCLTRLRALRAFAPYVPYSRALYTRLARFICSLAKTFYFPWIIKDTTNCVVLNKSFNLK